ncbi:nucleotidyltransferase family protein [Octadecabacter sp. 1_MG-2023]|uniref:nucleotidyltransferase family protein n=1 Tax=unclassified Octadecabacter TaxID=196158 RepID=UPI001C081F3A|nr:MULTISPECIES: nucleotidyltransferase family protein [unclassified Octadecabacter]MBU2993016.1 nucleotidyltransferase family protein [Octadecabacter sp. B2R22]MDO6733532.1 nucleotidyltransferase family protein [Octadecabacter sp. 1_MG-2023]
MDSFGAIILAAGLSRRMGDRNKLLLPTHGKPMIRHVVETYLSVVNERVWVVTGYENERIEAALQGLDVHIVHNENFEAGQPFSVRAGLLEARGAGHYLIGLGDQPDLTGGDLRALIAAHLAGDVQKISIPYQGTTRGNPVVVPAVMQARLLADQANPGCGKFTRDHPELAQHHTMTQPGFFNDIDTPTAFETFNKSTTLKDLT